MVFILEAMERGIIDVVHVLLSCVYSSGCLCVCSLLALYVCTILCVCAHVFACMLILCVHVFAMLCRKMFVNCHMFCMLVYIPLIYNYRYLRIVCFSSSGKVL